MGVPAQVPLDIIQLAFYVPALVVSFLVVRRHGMKRQLGWRYLLVLSLARLIGSGTGIAAAYDANKDLTEASDICDSIGISMLLGAALGILSRINDNMDDKQLPQLGMRLFYLPILGGLILTIYGSTKLFSGNPSDVSDGYKFSKAGSILFVLGLIILCGITLWCISNISRVEHDRRLVWVVAFSMPWLLVRVVYTIICAFTEGSKYFSQFGTNTIGVVVHGVMGLLPEIIVVTTYLWAGMTAKTLDYSTPPMKQPMRTQGPPMEYSQMQPAQRV